MDTSYTGQKLFIEKEEYRGTEKIAVVTLSRDGDDWEEQISQSLHQEHPFIAEHNIQVNLVKTDPESGVGTGSIQIDDKVLVPIIIEKFKLAPLDLFWHEDKLHPLTRNSLESVLQDTTMGTPVTPGEGGEVTDSSMYSRAQPPFDGKYTYAGLATTEEVAKALESAFESVDGVRYELKKNALFAGRVKALLASPRSEQVKVASAEKPRLAVRTIRPFEKVASFGPAEVAIANGQRIQALIFDQYYTSDGSLRDRSGFMAGLDKRASYSYLSPGQEVAGRACDPTATVPICEPASGHRGIFFKMASDGGVCIEPLTIQFATEDGWGVRDGMNQPFKLQKVAGLRRPVFTPKLISVPADWRWMKVGSETYPMSVERANLTEPHNLPSFSIHSFDGRVTVRGLEGFSPDGDDQEKVAAALNERFDHHDVSRVLAGAQALGTLNLCIRPVEDDGMRKTALRIRPTMNLSGLPFTPKSVNLAKEASFITTSKPLLFPARSDLTVKIAAVTDDQAKQTVDSLLGLNFLNPENIYRFAEKVGTVAKAKEVCAKLLLASRLGLDVDSRPLRTAMFALDAIERDLKELGNAAEVEEQEG